MERLKKGTKVRILRPGETQEAVGTVKVSFKELDFVGWVYVVGVCCGYEVLFDDELELLTAEERILEAVFGSA